MTRKITLILSLAVLALVAAMPTLAGSESDLNHESYWEAYYGPGYDCTKIEGEDLVLTEEGTVWVSTVDAEFVIVKAGSEVSTDTPHYEVEDVAVGDEVTHISGKQISHIIYCVLTQSSEEPSPSTTPEPTPVVTPVPTPVATPTPTPVVTPTPSAPASPPETGAVASPPALPDTAMGN